RRAGTAIGCGLALACWSAWVLYLKLLYDTWPFSPLHGNFDGPVHGIVYCWQQLGGNGTRWTIVVGLVLGQVALWFLLTSCFLPRRGEAVVLLLMLAGSVLTIVAGESIWRDFWSSTR